MNRKILFIGVMLTLVVAFSTTDVSASESLKKADSILTASSNIKAFVEKNGQLPNYITIENKKYSMDQYLYISSYSISSERGMHPLNSDGSVQLSSYTFSTWMKHDILCYGKNEIKKANKPTPRTIKADIDILTVYDMAIRTHNYISKNKKTPNVISSKYGDVQFQTAIYAYAKVLDYYKKNKAMPKYVSLNVAKTSKLAKYMPNF